MAKKAARLFLASAMTFALAFTATSVTLAQTGDTAATRTTEADDNGFDYGLLGLLGLLGLAGLKRRDGQTTHAPMR